MPQSVSLAIVRLIALTTTAAASTTTGAGGFPSRPNIVFAMVDDLGKEWISCYGAEGIDTPHIDRLADTGMRFNHVYSMPQCTPTRATLLTGQYPFRHGWVSHWDVPRWGHGCHFDPDKNPSIARVLKSVGYRTCVAGKWQINDFRIQPEVLGQLGFDEFMMWTGYESGNRPSAKRYTNPYLFTAEGSKTYPGGFGPDLCNDFLLDFIDKQTDEAPFFIYYPMILTHSPLTTTPHKPDVPRAERLRAMVEYMDHLVGRLTQKLEERGLRENTIVVWTTDNGTGGNSNRLNGRVVRGRKGQTLENGCCEPFIVSCPGAITEGAVSDALADFTDLLPTFAELAGAELPTGHTLDGKSFAPVLRGKSELGQREWIMSMGGGAGTYDESGRVINAYRYRDRVIRDRRYKLYVETDRSSAKLVDLVKDPGELVNRVGDPALSDALAKLQEVEHSFPAQDNSPRYTPQPPQPWDVVQKQPGYKGGPRGLPSNEPMRGRTSKVPANK